MSKIEWTDKTWNPIIGCSKISEGCNNCYAEKMAYRLAHIEMSNNENQYNYANVINFKSKTWNGKTHLVYSQLNKPLKRTKLTKYFVCSMSDLFHESIPFEWIEKVYDIMCQNPWHIFQVLTKRPKRMLEFYRYLGSKIKEAGVDSIPSESNNLLDYIYSIPNVWLGITAENQEMANKRIPILLQIPAMVKFVSIEPMLGKIKLTELSRHEHGWTFYDNALTGFKAHKAGGWYDNKLDWVICGGESGHNARPMHPDWVRSLRDQCKEAGVPFFFKQWGEWSDTVHLFDDYISKVTRFKNDNLWLFKIGKKKAGSLLDGKQYKEFPKL